MGITVWIDICSLQRMMVASWDTPENYLKDCIDWVLESLFLAVELLIIGTVLLITVSCTLLNNFKSLMHLHLYWRLDSG